MVIMDMKSKEEPNYLEVYNLCKNCKHARLIEEKHKLPKEVLKYRPKKTYVIRKRYDCMLEKCELKEV